MEDLILFTEKLHSLSHKVGVKIPACHSSALLSGDEPQNIASILEGRGRREGERGRVGGGGEGEGGGRERE